MIDNTRPYTIHRIATEKWLIDGHLVTSKNEARELCEQLDSDRGFEWDFMTYGEWADGMDCIKVGKSQMVMYPDDDC